MMCICTGTYDIPVFWLLLSVLQCFQSISKCVASLTLVNQSQGSAVVVKFISELKVSALRHWRSWINHRTVRSLSSSSFVSYVIDDILHVVWSSHCCVCTYDVQLMSLIVSSECEGVGLSAASSAVHTWRNRQECVSFRFYLILRHHCVVWRHCIHVILVETWGQCTLSSWRAVLF